MNEQSPSPLTLWFQPPYNPFSGFHGPEINTIYPDDSAYYYGEWLTPISFLHRIRYFLGEGMIYYFGWGYYPGRCVGDRILHDSLFSFIANNLEATEKMCKYMIGNPHYDVNLTKTILESIQSIKDHLNEEQILDLLNGEYSIQNYLRGYVGGEEGRFYVEAIEAFCDAFGQHELGSFLSKDFKPLRKKIQAISREILFLNSDDGYRKLYEESKAYFLALYESEKAELSKSIPSFESDFPFEEQYREKDIHRSAHEKKEKQMQKKISDLITLLSVAFWKTVKLEPAQKCRVLSDELYDVFTIIISEYTDGAFYFASLNPIIRELLIDFDKLEPLQKVVIKKFYHASVYFGGTAPKYFKESFKSYGLNCYDGFQSNLSALTKIVVSRIWKYYGPLVASEEMRNYPMKISIDDNPDNDVFFYDYEREIRGALTNTKAQEAKLLETAYYLREFHRYSPLFSGMEYTPLMVCLYKAVEILICDFIEKLGLHKASYKGGKLIIGDLIESYAGDDWRTSSDATLGGLNVFLRSVNQDSSDVFDESGAIITTRVRAYNSKLSGPLRTDLLSKMEDFESSYGAKFGFHFRQLRESNPKASELLYDIIATWIKFCRNANLHKDNTKDETDFEHDFSVEEKLDFTFDFTSFVIAALIKWHYLLQ